MQETHLNSTDEKLIHNRFGDNCFFNNGTNFAGGVCIIIPNGVDFKLKKIDMDHKGRYIILEGCFNKQDLTLVNIYSPTQDKREDQNEFFNKIYELINGKSSNLIWTGDFNLYLDPNLDQYKESGNKTNDTAEQLKIYMEENNISDSWRLRNPDVKRFTWRRSDKDKTQQSRLDYFLVADALMYAINQVNIHPSFMSDHNIISITLHTNTNPSHGKGTWKFNSTLLCDPEYTNSLNVLIDSWIQKYNYVMDMGLKWEMIKCEIRGHTIGYCSRKKKMDREYEHTLLHENTELEKLMCTDPNENIKQRLATNMNELKAMDNEKLKGAQLRAKCLHINENEYNTKYFLDKEKSKAGAKSMTTLITDDNITITDSKIISIEQRNFYKNLYSDTKIDKASYVTARDYFLKNDNIHIEGISDVDRDALDIPITYEEISNSLKELPNNKSPGSDGLNANFYKYFWKKIRETVCASLRYGIDNGKLSIEQRRAILSLLPKKDKDARLLKNWRPLSILNTDYKILAKVLARRLQSVLTDLIHQDQSGCLKGRSTFSNLRSSIDVINYANENNLAGYLAFIDYEKAFDTVKWSFLYSCMEKMNFGKTYIKFVQTLYNEIGTHVLNSGNLSEGFSPSRGIRQGCPISAYLFILIVEIMASAIRQDPQIIGINIGEHICKISQYADDTCMYTSDVESLKNIFELLNRFALCSGLKVNKDKSEAMGIGASTNYKHKELGIKWPDKPIKCLGVYFFNDIDKLVEYNLSIVLERCTNILKAWNIQKLSIKGKVLVANTLVIPQILYLSTIIKVPDTVISNLQNKLVNFIWEGKPPKIKYACLINKIENGGLKLQDIDSKIRSLKLKWLKAMCDQKVNSIWKSYLVSHLKKDIHDIMTYNININEYYNTGNKFYQELFDIWCSIHCTVPKNSEEYCRQAICNNHLLKVDNKAITDKIWPVNNKIKFIQHLIDDKRQVATKQYLDEKYDVTIPQMSYNSIVSAIPSNWKKEIENDPNIANYYVFNDYKIQLNETSKKIIEFSTKDLYWHILSKKAKRPTSEESWETEVGLGFEEKDWEHIYIMPYLLTRNTRLIHFQLKITHRILACKDKLFCWKIKDSNICDKCKVNIDNIEHHLIACPTTKIFWDCLFKWWRATMEMLIPLDTYDILFGIQNHNADIIISQINFTILHAKYFVYNCNRNEEVPDLYKFLLELKSTFKCLQLAMTNDGKEDHFNKAWGELYNNI